LYLFSHKSQISARVLKRGNNMVCYANIN